jgi:hypothetical protein
MVWFDIRLKPITSGIGEGIDEWSQKMNKKTKRVATAIHFTFLEPPSCYVVLYSSYYIDEETVFKDVLHEITETTIILAILKSFGYEILRNKLLADVSHTLTEISLYDTTRPIILGRTTIQPTKFDKKIEKYLKSLGYEYITPVIEGVD